MDILIRVLQGSDAVPLRLRKDGWQLRLAANDSFLACHPSVADEPQARLRLQKLGLLTSRALRIEFPIANCFPIGGPVERN